MSAAGNNKDSPPYVGSLQGRQASTIGVRGVRTSQFLAVWSPPICGHPRSFHVDNIYVRLYCSKCSKFVQLNLGKFIKIVDNSYTAKVSEEVNRKSPRI